MSDFSISDGANIIMAICAVYAAFSAWQSSRKSGEASKDSKRSADAAHTSAKIAETSLVALERPYLYILDICEIRRCLSEKGKIDIVPFSLANYGKVPATITKLFFGIGTEQSASLTSSVNVNEMTQTIVNKVLAPSEKNEGYQARLGEASPAFFSKDKIERGESSGKYFWIEVFYKGIFPTEYRSFACWEYNPTGLRLQQTTLDLN